MGWVVNAIPRPPSPRERPVPVVKEAGSAAGPVWTDAENLAQPGFDPRTVKPVVSRRTDCAMKQRSETRDSFHEWTHTQTFTEWG